MQQNQQLNKRYFPYQELHIVIPQIHAGHLIRSVSCHKNKFSLSVLSDKMINDVDPIAHLKLPLM